MKIRGHEVDSSCIVSLVPDIQAVVLKTKNLALHESADMSFNGMIRLRVSESEFQMAKFEYIRLIKTKKDPSDRVDPFLECVLDEGGIDLKRMDELVELRKSPQEKQKELEEESELLLKFKKSRLSYYGPLKIS